MTRSRAARGGWRVAAAVLVLAACDGHLDFGARRNGDGSAGAPTCAADGDCPAFLPHCDLGGSRTCVACASNNQCTTAGALRCDPALHRCVACLAQGDCAIGQICASGRCVTTCHDDSTISCPTGMSCHSGVCSVCGDDDTNASACASRTATPVCLPSWGACVACRNDLDCGGAQPRCDPLSRACVQCVSPADCTAAAPYCNPGSGTCAAG